MSLAEKVRNYILAAVLPLSLYFTSLSIFQTLLLAFVVFVFAYYENSDPRKSGLPPGPKSFPVIGRLPWMLFKKDLQEDSLKLHQEYGPIMTNTVASIPMVSISDYNLIKEFGMHPDFQLRNDFGVFNEITNGLGLISAEGQLWKHQKRFLLSSLRNAGMGKMSIEFKINEELEEIKKVIKKSGGQPMQLQELFEKSTSNIMVALAFNKRFEYTDENFIRRIKALDENFKLLLALSIFAMFKWLKPFSGFVLRKLKANFEVLKSQSQEFIDEHRKSLDPDDPRDLLDDYLVEMQSKGLDGDDESEYHKTFSEEQLKFLIIDVFTGGTETASTTIRWALLYMIRYPEVQEKVQKELDEILGHDGIPSTANKSKLPYTVATLQEIERLSSIVPTSIVRSNDHKVTWRGYCFPKRSIVGFNLYACHRDPKYWPNPEKFDPSRFINEDGNVFRPPQLIPFGSGRRACPGEALGKMEIFLYFANLLKNFRFESPRGEPLPTMDIPKGALRRPNDYKISCYPRSS